MRTATKVLIAYGVFVLANVALAWIAFFQTSSTPDTLLTLVLGVGGIVDACSAAVAIFCKKKEVGDD